MSHPKEQNSCILCDELCYVIILRPSHKKYSFLTWSLKIGVNMKSSSKITVNSKKKNLYFYIGNFQKVGLRISKMV